MVVQAAHGASAETIIDHALDIVVIQGMSALTLRPLAQRAGVSVAVISARTGTKTELIKRVISEGHARDRAFFARWLDIAAALGTLDPAARAALADTAFRDWLSSGRQQAFLLIEQVHERALRRVPDPALAQWLADAGTFWSNLLFGVPDVAELALGYVLDEAGFTLGAGNNPRFGLLRLLCLQRLVGGMFAQSAAVAADPTIPRLIAMLKPASQTAATPADAKRQHIADCAAQIIVSQGIAAVTHRSVALAAGVPASTVVYHFGAQPALVIAGLHSVIARFHGARTKPGRNDDGELDQIARRRDLVKATSLIALASAREPSLIPDALDMRRRRGENIRAEDAAELGLAPGAHFDRAGAQVMAIALFGMQMVAMASNLPEQDYYRRGFAALSNWRAARTN